MTSKKRAFGLFVYLMNIFVLLFLHMFPRSAVYIVHVEDVVYPSNKLSLTPSNPSSGTYLFQYRLRYYATQVRLSVTL